MRLSFFAILSLLQLFINLPVSILLLCCFTGEYAVYRCYSIDQMIQVGIATTMHYSLMGKTYCFCMINFVTVAFTFTRTYSDYSRIVPRHLAGAGAESCRLCFC